MPDNAVKETIQKVQFWHGENVLCRNVAFVPVHNISELMLHNREMGNAHGSLKVTKIAIEKKNVV